VGGDDCGQYAWSALGWHSVASERALLMGVRSLSPEAESVRVRESAMRVVPWRDGLPQHGVETTLDAFARELDGVYLHLDLDALDPSVGLGIVDRQLMAAYPAHS
jgi:arginase family enzyme